MKYAKLKANDETYWFEINQEGFVFRQIINSDNGEISLSCLEDCLAEGEFCEDDLEGDFEYITEEKFSEMWKKCTNPYQEKWSQTKEKYYVGKIIHGMCKCFYPQGTMIEGEDFLAVCDEECLQLHENVIAKVVGYDEINMWLVVISCGEEKPDVEAVFEFVDFRKDNVYEGYRPAHLVCGSYLSTGVHSYYNLDECSKEKLKGTITFLNPEAYPKSMWIGKEIEIYEGSRFVGYATITDILNPILCS